MSSIELLVLAGSSAIDLVVLLSVLWSGGQRPASLRRLACALAVTCLSAGVKAALALEVTPSLFFVVAFAYVDLVVVTPLAALIALLRARVRPLSLATRAAAWLALLGLPALGGYASFYEPFRLVEERVSVPIAPQFAPSTPLRVAVLADIQSRDVDEHLRDAVRSAMAFDPHLIVLPGDLIQRDSGYDEVVPRFRELLQPLRAPLGVYFVIGNTDDRDRVQRVFEGSQIRLLVDETVDLEFHGRRVVLGGADFHFASERARAFVRSFDQRDADELRILVAHYPDVLLGLDDSPAIDLTLAGHTHGGQVKLPWIGALVTLSRTSRRVGSGGLNAIDGRAIYVSRGIGCERGPAPRIRFFCPPEVSLLTLEAAER